MDWDGERVIPVPAVLDVVVFEELMESKVSERGLERNTCWRGIDMDMK